MKTGRLWFDSAGFLLLCTGRLAVLLSHLGY